MTPLRVALLDHAGGAYARELATALSAAGHAPHLLGSRARAPAEAILRRRGFTPALSHVPGAALELLRGEFDVAHAFTAPDAAAALAWRRVSGRPVVFTCAERIGRENAADARLRLAMLTRALEQTDAVVAADADVRAGLGRWFACSPPVLPPGDAAAHEALYRKLLAGRAAS